MLIYQHITGPASPSRDILKYAQICANDKGPRGRFSLVCFHMTWDLCINLAMLTLLWIVLRSGDGKVWEGSKWSKGVAWAAHASEGWVGKGLGRLKMKHGEGFEIMYHWNITWIFSMSTHHMKDPNHLGSQYVSISASRTGFLKTDVVLDAGRLVTSPSRRPISYNGEALDGPLA